MEGEGEEGLEDLLRKWQGDEGGEEEEEAAEASLFCSFFFSLSFQVVARLSRADDGVAAARVGCDKLDGCEVRDRAVRGTRL